MDFIGNNMGYTAGGCTAENSGVPINWRYNVMSGGTCGSHRPQRPQRLHQQQQRPPPHRHLRRQRRRRPQQLPDHRHRRQRPQPAPPTQAPTSAEPRERRSDRGRWYPSGRSAASHDPTPHAHRRFALALLLLLLALACGVAGRGRRTRLPLRRDDGLGCGQLHQGGAVPELRPRLRVARPGQIVEVAAGSYPDQDVDFVSGASRRARRVQAGPGRKGHHQRPRRTTRRQSSSGTSAIREWEAHETADRVTFRNVNGRGSGSQARRTSASSAAAPARRRHPPADPERGRVEPSADEHPHRRRPVPRLEPLRPRRPHRVPPDRRRQRHHDPPQPLPELRGHGHPRQPLGQRTADAQHPDREQLLRRAH